MFSETNTKFHANILSAWLSTSLTMIMLVNVGAYEMLSASSLLFTIIFIVGIYFNAYRVILKLNVDIKTSQMRYYKFIPIIAIILYEITIFLDMYNIIKDKENVVETLRVYNINNYKIHYQVLDADYAYTIIKNVGIISYTTNICFTWFVIYKLWTEERKIFNVVDWNSSVLAYSKQGERSSVTNIDIESQSNKNLFDECFWMSISKISFIILAPLTLFSVINLNVLPNILYTLFIDSGKEIYVLSCIDLGLMIGTIIVYKCCKQKNEGIFIKVMLIHMFLITGYLVMCDSKQYGMYEFIKVQDYALAYTGTYSIILTIYIYQVCSINYLVNNKYIYQAIPTEESLSDSEDESLLESIKVIH